MKTPREILLERHQAATEKLDAIRQSAVAAVCDRREANDARELQSQTAATMILKTFWRELILPCRRIWAGLAAVWVLIFIFNFSQRAPSGLMAKKLPPSPEMIMTFRQQQRLLAELIGPNEPQAVEPPPKAHLPPPRSERRFETLTA